MDIKELNDYLEYLKYQKNYSDYTVENYKHDIIEYLEYLNSENLSFKDIEYSDIRFYLMYLKDTKKDDNTSINRKLSSLRGFYKYLANEGIVKTNVFSLVNGPKKSKKLPRYFEYNELEELFNVPDTRTPLGQRDSLILEMLYATGVRVGELVNIKVSDIDLGRRNIIILGKGNKERFVTYGEYCEDILKTYLNNGRFYLNSKSSDYLFLNNNGGRLTDRGVRFILDKLIHFNISIIDTNTFDNAQVCKGGIPLTEINTNTFESLIVPNLYFTGEIIDVDGKCGGYNIAFSAISAILAGKDIAND